MSRKMVMFVTPCSSLHGGVETILRDLGGNLPGFGWDVELALASGRWFNLYDRYSSQYPELETHRVMPRAYNSRARVAAIMDLIQNRTPDLVVATRIADTFEAVSRLKRRGSKVRLGAAVRSLEAGYLQDLLTFRDYIDACFADGRLISAACSSIAKISPGRVFNLPGGVRMPVVTRSESSDPATLRLGYVGRLSNSDKRVFDLIPLLDKLDAGWVRYSLDIFGAGPDAEELKQRLMNETRSENVRFHGWKSSKELYEYALPGLDVLLNFSPTEGVTISPREAMAHGVVPVISRFPGLVAEGVFCDGVNSVTFDVGDLDGAAAAVKKLSNDSTFFNRLSVSASQSQTGIYSFEGSMSAWADAIDATQSAPIACGSTLPVTTTPSRFERLGLPAFAADRIRFFLRREPIPSNPGDEWPHVLGSVSIEVEQCLRKLAMQLDNHEKYFSCSNSIKSKFIHLL